MWLAIATTLVQVRQGGRPFGAALATAGVAERDVERFLAARGDTLRDGLADLVRRLAAKGIDAVDLAAPATLLLADLTADHEAREWAIRALVHRQR